MRPLTCKRITGKDSMLLKSLSEKVGQYTLVLIMLLIALIALPFFAHFPVGRMLLTVWGLLTVSLLVFSVSQGKRQRLRVVLLGAPLLISVFIFSVGQFLAVCSISNS